MRESQSEREVERERVRRKEVRVRESGSERKREYAIPRAVTLPVFCAGRCRWSYRGRHVAGSRKRRRGTDNSSYCWTLRRREGSSSQTRNKS